MNLRSINSDRLQRGVPGWPGALVEADWLCQQRLSNRD